MLVSDVKCRMEDAAGVNILEVYVKQEPHYAIYRTEERVMVHFADNGEEAKQQMGLLAPLNPVRGEIYGLLDGWQSSWFSRAKFRARCYTRRIADALGVALQDDATSALTLLAGIKADILDERTSWARFLYLIAASTVALMVVLLVRFVTWNWEPSGDAWYLWFALTGGTIGAFFSITVGIRSRTVRTDLQWIANTADAVLRVVVGAIAAGVLVSLVLLHAFKLTIGDATVGADGQISWLYILVVAFVAGFSERLIPDLLAKSVPAAELPPPQTQAAVSSSPAETVAAAGVMTDLVPDQVQEHKDLEDRHQLDDCLCDHAVQPHEATDDADLPVATGGIAAPRAAVGAGAS